MADFEGLINQALAKQDSRDPSVRERVYQSSRNALVKMLEKTGIVSDDAVRSHFEKLENSIQKIEARYQPAQQPIVEEPTPAQQAPIIPEPQLEPSIPEEPTAPAPELPIQTAAAERQATPPQLQTLQPETATPDIIDELEALLPSSYQPEPLFPAVETPRPEPARPAEVASPSESANPMPVASPQPTAQPPAANVRQPAAPIASPEPPVRPAAPKQPNRPVDPSFEDDFTIPEKVDSYLGETRSDETFPDHFEDEPQREPVHVYKRKNPFLRRIWPIFLALAVVLVILWILYALLANMPQENSAQNSGVTVGPVGESQVGEDGSIFITLLEPTDLSALVTAGRGSAELITQQNQQVLRLQSVRQGALTASGAEPILLELEKGVLNQISGKSVTVELYAKSGQNGPAQFAVECDFAGDSICGRKRFRVGTQPERIVFALDLTGGIRQGERAYLAINTDITNSADSSGNGDAIDVIYVRLRLPGE